MGKMYSKTIAPRRENINATQHSFISEAAKQIHTLIQAMSLHYYSFDVIYNVLILHLYNQCMFSSVTNRCNLELGLFQSLSNFDCAH